MQDYRYKCLHILDPHLDTTPPAAILCPHTITLIRTWHFLYKAIFASVRIHRFTVSCHRPHHWRCKTPAFPSSGLGQGTGVAKNTSFYCRWTVTYSQLCAWAMVVRDFQSGWVETFLGLRQNRAHWRTGDKCSQRFFFFLITIFFLPASVGQLVERWPAEITVTGSILDSRPRSLAMLGT